MSRPVRTGNYKEENFDEAANLIRAAAADGAKIAVTFEQFLDGYGRDANKMDGLSDPDVDRCEVYGKSDYVTRLAELASELGIVIVAGLALAEPDDTYNSAIVFGKDGTQLGRYRKTHNAGTYATWFAPLTAQEKHTSCPSFDLGAGKIGIKICNDRHFRETTTYLIENGCELLLCPSFGEYDPAGLVDDSKEFGIWTVFVHPEGCQFIEDGAMVSEQRHTEGTGSYAISELEYRVPRR
jgi:predicted amidohydrolase